MLAVHLKICWHPLVYRPDYTCGMYLPGALRALMFAHNDQSLLLTNFFSDIITWGQLLLESHSINQLSTEASICSAE